MGDAGESGRIGRLLTVAALAAAATTVVATVPGVRFAYDNASLHVGLETAEALVGALLAFLATARHRATGRAADLLLSWSFGVLAATNLVLAAGPNIVLEDRAVGFATWAAAGLRVLGTAGIAAAAALGDRVASTRVHRRIGLASAMLVLGVLTLAGIADAVLGRPIDPGLAATTSSRPTFIGHEVLLVLQSLGVVLFALAAHWFLRQAAAPALHQWLAIGCVLGSFSRLHYVLFSSLYTSWVSTGDLLRLASYCAFLTGAGSEIRSWWQAQSELVAARERGRIALDLHDGLAQELSFISSETASRTAMDATRTAVVSDAADRALLDARRLVRVLHDDDVDIEDALGDALVGAVRAGIDVEVAVHGLEAHRDGLASAVRAAVVGVTREAATNATRHGGATHLWARLELGRVGGMLTIVDDGGGFDTDVPRSGFGLRGMRQRANSVGGEIEICSAPDRGTTVTLNW